MTKVLISPAEWWPVIDICPVDALGGGGDLVDIPQELLDARRSALNALDAADDAIIEHLKATKQKSHWSSGS